MAYAPGQGKRARWNGVEVASQDDLRGRSQVFIFVPESLLLVKGSPARRRAHLDAFAAALDPQYAAAVRDLQASLRQRNAQLARRQERRRPRPRSTRGTRSSRGSRPSWGAAAAIWSRSSRRILGDRRGPGPGLRHFTLRLVAQLDGVGYDEAALLDELRARRPGEIGRGLSLFGPHRDDLKFLEVGPESRPPDGETTAEPPATPATRAGRIPTVAGGPACGPIDLPRGGRDLRLFGSQGEQRAAVLALLLAEQRLAAARTGTRGRSSWTTS